MRAVVHLWQAPPCSLLRKSFVNNANNPLKSFASRRVNNWEVPLLGPPGEPASLIARAVGAPYWMPPSSTGLEPEAEPAEADVLTIAARRSLELRIEMCSGI